MARKPTSFTIGGTRFEGEFLDPLMALEGFSVLAPKVGAVFAAAGEDADLKTILNEAARSADVLNHFAPIFRKVYKADFDGKTLPLEHFWDEVFKGRPALLIGWLVSALKAEYESVFLEEGSNIFEDLAESFGFRSESNESGSSGDSSQTSD